MSNKPDCCSSKPRSKSGFWSGLLFGLLPHSFCIAFIVFSVLGATLATTFFRRLLILPYFFQMLIALSFIFATLSAIIYLRRCGLLSWQGIKSKTRYLLILYATTIGINLLFFRVIFPLTANFGANTASSLAQVENISLKVAIPCPGHAPLIGDELKKLPGVVGMRFKMPNLFEVSFESDKISVEKILSLEVFKTFRATIL